MLFKGRVSIGLIVWLVSFSTLAVEQPWQQPSYIQDAFYRIALKSEYVEGEHGVRKWRESVRYTVSHVVSDSELHNKLVRYHLDHLQSLTGINFIPASHPKAANLTIVFTNHQRFLDDARQYFKTNDVTPLRKAVCAANFAVDKNGWIRRAAVVIPVDLARSKGKLVACVVEELTQIMGLPNDDDNVFPSIFNDRTPEQLLTGLDGLLLRLLYLPDIQAGQNWRQVEPIIAPVIESWARDGTIEHAHRAVRTGELYQLLGW